LSNPQTRFKQSIRQAIDNPYLQTALDINAERRKQARRDAYQSLPVEQDKLKQRAREIRFEVISNLESYLERFSRRLIEHGFTVHRATDPHDACQIILEIARSRDARLVAKSKSMVTEEIHLNQALNAAGIKVIETDLGEFIIQLRNEPPSHIITPAVHLRREDVATTFQQHFGAPDTDEIHALNAVAQRELRKVFLNLSLEF
jgi:L-lactate dehydrogenase complex protein LldF